MGAGPGGAKCVEARSSRKRMAAAEGPGGGFAQVLDRLACGGEWRQRLRVREEGLGRRLRTYCVPQPTMRRACLSRARLGPQPWRRPSPPWSPSKSFRRHPQQVLGVFAQGKAEQAQSCGNGLLSCPSPGPSPTLPSPPGPAKVSQATSPWAAWPRQPFLGPAPQLGVDRAV